MVTYEMYTQQHKDEKNYTLPEQKLFNSGRVMFIICLVFTALIVVFASARG